jgi:hypothetical protein
MFSVFVFGADVFEFEFELVSLGGVVVVVEPLVGTVSGVPIAVFEPERSSSRSLEPVDVPLPVLERRSSIVGAAQAARRRAKRIHVRAGVFIQGSLG